MNTKLEKIRYYGERLETKPTAKSRTPHSLLTYRPLTRSGFCRWQRVGEPWPDNNQNYWQTSCGASDHGRLAMGLCPHCARVVEARALEVGE